MKCYAMQAMRYLNGGHLAAIFNGFFLSSTEGTAWYTGFQLLTEDGEERNSDRGTFTKEPVVVPLIRTLEA